MLEPCPTYPTPMAGPAPDWAPAVRQTRWAPAGLAGCPGRDWHGSGRGLRRREAVRLAGPARAGGAVDLKAGHGREEE